MDIIYMIPDHFSIPVGNHTAQGQPPDQHEFNSEYKKKSNGDQEHLYHRNDGRACGSPVTTLFVPINEAWKKLSSNLLAYLLFPFGERTFRKLMMMRTFPLSATSTSTLRSRRTCSTDRIPTTSNLKRKGSTLPRSMT
ncbi:hypothetical protein FRB94_012715 [Tulasnella sp. JGI-2019a]|nr:hypothetical protein FRB94_012715 [Tulasnella sp. JGI-2019a]KAG9018427.1 hypothetical protein FRB93_000130 [Tulasnella sp. JGI-2019a]KAG9037520.1 hypothetical protein FRB95_005102 [Tulasnella sp. JGI-2019a]